MAARKVPKNSPRYKAAVNRRKKNTALNLAAEEVKRKKKLAALTGKKPAGGKVK